MVVQSDDEGMDERVLAELAAPSELFDRMLSLAALDAAGTGPYYDEMLLRVDESSLRTPAGSTDAPVSAYCSATTELLDSVDSSHDAPVTAVFDIGHLRGWLSWVDDGDGVSVRFVGDPATGRASHIELASGDATATVDCVDDPGLYDELPLELPGRFTDGERFLLADGTPAPTVVETTARQLRRIADGVRAADAADAHPVVVADGSFRFELVGDGTVRASDALAGQVSGPDVHNEYGDGFAHVAAVLAGEVTLQTGPDAPLAVVTERSGFTLRYVLSPVES